MITTLITVIMIVKLKCTVSVANNMTGLEQPCPLTYHLPCDFNKLVRPSLVEQSASTRHVRTLYVCFPRTLEGFSLQAFLSMIRYLNFRSASAVTVVIFGHLNHSFLLYLQWRRYM